MRVDFGNPNFKSCAWKFSGDWQFLDNIATDFQEIHLSRIPVKVEYMVIYSNVNVREAGDSRQRIACCTRCTAIRGYIEGESVPLAVWSTWLNQGLSWATVNEIAFDPEYLADVARANDATSTWRVLVTHGTRPHFRAQGKAFRFDLRVEIIAACGTDDPTVLLDVVKHKFFSMSGAPDDYDNGDSIRCKGITYMEVMCDVRSRNSFNLIRRRGRNSNSSLPDTWARTNRKRICSKTSDLKWYKKWQKWPRNGQGFLCRISIFRVQCDERLASWPR